jgi:hypothetical protein
MISFAQDTQQQAYERIAALVTQLYGEAASPVGDWPAFRLTRGPSSVVVAVEAWGEDRAVLAASSWVVLGAERSEELYRFLLERSFEQRFGSFTMDAVGDNQFMYRMPADLVDKEAVRTAIEAVLWTTSRFDSEIIARFGGMRQADAAAARDFERSLEEAGLRLPPEDDQEAA